MSEKARARLFRILEATSDDDAPARAFAISIITLICLNVVAVLLESVEDFSDQYDTFFDAFEAFSVSVFSIEYLLRLWTCTTDDRFRHPVKGRLAFAFTPLALVDLVSILPFYLPMLLPLDLRFVRSLRLFRLIRVLKIARYSQALHTLGYVLRRKSPELLTTALGAALFLLMASSAMYFVEHEAHPHAFPSIPAALWWGVVTLTTVGYGDVYPITPLGKVLGSIIALLGVGMFVLPAGILASGFAEEMRSGQRGPRVCPHCGKDIDQAPEAEAGSRQRSESAPTR